MQDKKPTYNCAKTGLFLLKSGTKTGNEEWHGDKSGVMSAEGGDRRNFLSGVGRQLRLTGISKDVRRWNLGLG